MTLHPLLRLAIKEPHLLVDHLSAYAALASEEVSKTTTSLAVQVGLFAGAGVFAFLGLLLTGVALLLAAATPAVDHTTWGLIAVPLTPVIVSAVLVVIARAKTSEKPFGVLKDQLEADMAMIRKAAGDE